MLRARFFSIRALLRLVWNLTTRCLAVTGGGVECGRSSQPSWLLGALQYSYTYLLTYFGQRVAWCFVPARTAVFKTFFACKNIHRHRKSMADPHQKWPLVNMCHTVPCHTVLSGAALRATDPRVTGAQNVGLEWVWGWEGRGEMRSIGKLR